MSRQNADGAMWGQDDAYDIAAFAAGLVIMAWLAIAVEFPGRWWVPVYDQVALPHALALTATAVAWWGAARLEGCLEGWTARAVAAIAIGVVLLVGILTYCPKLVAGPFVDHGEIGREWLNTVAEWQPLWPTLWIKSPGVAWLALRELGAPIAVGVYLAVGLWRSQWGSASWRNVALLTSLVVFVGFSFTAVRWSPYAQAAALMPWTELLLRAWRERPRPAAQRTVLVLVALGFVWLGDIVPATIGTIAGDRRPADCPVHLLSDAALRPALRPGAIVLTYLFVSPEVEWRTDWAVVGIPSANSETIRDVAAVLGAADDGQALGVLRRRGVEYLLLCSGSLQGVPFRRDDGASLHQRLERDAVPSWLSPVELPRALHGLRVYAVSDNGRTASR